jgi:L-ascorbate metabolism protein UlaG (beta-lactamase superfamily)
MRAAMHREVATPETTVQLEWLGHSSFLMTSPDGLRVLIDPSALYPPSPTPDVVTVSNLHGTHSAVEWVKGSPRVLWGLSLPDARWNRIATTIRDVSLFIIPSYASRTQLEESPVQNSIFVFRTGGFCIVHLGNLRHPLTAQQLQQIGTPDVVMIPVDGQWTMSYTDVISVITQLQPRLVIPMHIDVTPHADVFVRYTQGRYPVRRLAGRTLTLRRSDLPAATEIVMFSDRQD